MSDYEGEIEFLDEDADIVQQCIQSQQITSMRVPTPTDSLLIAKSSKIIQSKVKTNVRDEETDSDYDPRDEFVPVRHTTKIAKPVILKNKASSTNLLKEFETRKKLRIKVPDYDDPVFLPGKSVASDGNSVQILKNWNSMVTFSSDKSEYSLMPQRGKAVASKRMTVLKKLKNKDSGKRELNLWYRVSVSNNQNESRTEVLQCILPKFIPTKTVAFNMRPPIKRKPKAPHVSEVILTKEENKDGSQLVVYKLQDAISSVYDMVEKSTIEDGTISTNQHLAEKACCRICASCYHMSYRGKTPHTDKKQLQCPACLRAHVSAYNLLAHMRAHRDDHVRCYKHAISKILSRVVTHQYACRICDAPAHTIAELRKHLHKHKCSEVFMCEICNRVTR